MGALDIDLSGRQQRGGACSMRHQAPVETPYIKEQVQENQYVNSK
jgi:hypothetical protein